MIGKVYRHFRNQKLYKIVDIIFDATNDNEVILYEPLYNTNYKFFTRTKEDFFKQIIPVGEKGSVYRFQEIKYEDGVNLA